MPIEPAAQGWMKGFATLDYVAVGLYLLAIAVIGSSFYRRGATAKEYFLGGRSMPWIAAGISIVAADLSAISVMGSPAWGYKNNLQLIWMPAAYPICAPIVILVFVPFYSKLNLYTAYEYLERRFSLPVRLLVSMQFQVLRGWHVAVAIYGPALVINLVTGFPVWQCVLVMGLFTTLYTALGGIRAVIWTDVIQFFTVTSGIALIFTVALRRVPGGIPAAYHAALDAGRLSFVNPTLDPAQLTSIWACLIGGIVLCMAPLTTDQAILQRLFTTKSAKDCRQSVMLQAFLIVPIISILYLTGTALFAFYHFHPERLAGLTNTDAIVPFFAVRELPSGMSGLVVAAIFAASMAVMSAGINSLTTASTVDFYQRVFRPDRPPEHYAMVGRAGTVFWGVAVTFTGLLASKAGDLVLAYNRVSAVVSGPMLGIFLLGTLTRRASAMGCLLGAAAGMIAVGLTITLTRWSFFYQGPIGVVTTFGAGYLASLFTPAPAPDRVKGLVMGA
ncbi:MAG: sodium/solute symporter [Bryobacterales bacterium]|nr:sodium/solute symporter [Bryobacterales bacterium]